MITGAVPAYKKRHSERGACNILCSLWSHRLWVLCRIQSHACIKFWCHYPCLLPPLTWTTLEVKTLFIRQILRADITRIKILIQKYIITFCQTEKTPVYPFCCFKRTFQVVCAVAEHNRNPSSKHWLLHWSTNSWNQDDFVLSDRVSSHEVTKTNCGSGIFFLSLVKRWKPFYVLH